MDRAGIETMLMNYYRNIDRNKVQFDFLTHRPDSGDYDLEIESLGGKVFHAPRLYPQNYIRYIYYMRKLFIEHPEYKIIHSHIDAMSAFPLAAAKKAKIPIRIGHSHSTSIDKDYKLPIKWMAKNCLPSLATDYFACSEEAVRFLFGQEIYESRSFTLMKNAIPIQDFSFRAEIRDRVRNEFNLKDSFILGHIGRFAYPKNQSYLVDVFNELCKLHSNSILFLIGDGEDRKRICEKVIHLGLEQRVRFLGIRSDISNLLQAMDFFVLPSYYEGFPVVGVEAQAADLPCLFSDAITKDIQLTDNCWFLPINLPPEKWAEEILKRRSSERCSHEKEMRLAGFDVVSEAENLQRYYLNRWREVIN